MQKKVPDRKVLKNIIRLFLENRIALAMRYRFFAGRSAWRWEVFSQGHRKYQSVVPCKLLHELP